ncbi:hypothetical protein [Fodinibius salsisoli]|uniref:Uncharacterized protein n=1 Tax=Fodinibius salsisoli TaxID=2820877 RepID=A0ABT3PM10_9BACT|nr:hypothetical protein [Fodinibius salsisoli]MCW9706981.1 hypothetical protein [Fodinibius salsisoli]
MKKYNFINENEQIIILDNDRYIRIKTYRTDGDSLLSLSDREFISILMRQPLYNHLLVGPIGYDKEDNTIQGSGQHGPYALSSLSPDLYKRITKEEFLKRLQEHYDDPDYLINGENQVPDTTVQKADKFLSNIFQRSCNILSLELRPYTNEEHKKHYGETPLHHVFYEYIFIEEDIFHFFIFGED